MQIAALPASQGCDKVRLPNGTRRVEERCHQAQRACWNVACQVATYRSYRVVAKLRAPAGWNQDHGRGVEMADGRLGLAPNQ